MWVAPAIASTAPRRAPSLADHLESPGSAFRITHTASRPRGSSSTTAIIFMKLPFHHTTLKQTETNEIASLHNYGSSSALTVKICGRAGYC